MDLSGIKVYHTSKFGNGEVISQNGNYITVKFECQDNPIKFVYPDCFKNFLQIKDSNISLEVSKDIEKKNASKKPKLNFPTNSQL